VRQPPVMEVDDQTYLMHLSDRNSTTLRPFGGLPNHLGGSKVCLGIVANRPRFGYHSQVRSGSARQR
jgi:hypothetical protein